MENFNDDSEMGFDILNFMIFNIFFSNRPLVIDQKSLDRALLLYIFIHEIRSSGVRASITIVRIRKFYKT